MSRKAIDDAGLEAEIGRLPELSLLELRHRWKTLFGHPAPKSLRRNFLARAVAYQMQVEAYGGLSVATKRRLREIAHAARNGDANAMLGSGRIKPRHADDPAMAEHQPYRYGIGGRIRVERSDLQITLRRCQCHHRYQLERVFVLWHQTGAIWQQKRVGAAAKQLACRS